jgi:hypothetical protein
MARSRRRPQPAAAVDAPFKGDESGAFRWTLFEGVMRQCRQCGREPLRIKDVGEHRTLYPGRRTEFLCVECQRANTDERVEENRRALGLPPLEKSA